MNASFRFRSLRVRYSVGTELVTKEFSALSLLGVAGINPLLVPPWASRERLSRIEVRMGSPLDEG